MAVKPGRPYKCVVCSESIKGLKELSECQKCNKKAHKVCATINPNGSSNKYFCTRCEQVSQLITSTTMPPAKTSTQPKPGNKVTTAPQDDIVSKNSSDSDILKKILDKVTRLEDQVTKLTSANVKLSSEVTSLSAALKKQGTDSKLPKDKGKARSNSKEKEKRTSNDQEKNETSYSNNSIYMIEGNLLEAMDTEGFSAAHCVARDMRMGRGIALKLKTKLNIDTETLRKNCQVSDIVEMKIGDDYLLNLVTKKISRELPNWNDFKKTIKKLPETCDRLKIKKLVMPKIGCGLDAFKWPSVMKLLKSVFYNSNVEVYVLYNDKDEEPMYVRSKDGKKKFLKKDNRKATTEIVGDSHAKGILQILRKDKDQAIYAQAIGGATTSTATKNLNMYSSYLSPEDNLVVVTGTNDTDLNNENQDLTCHDEARKDIVSQAKHTKVTILTIPYRYDKTDANSKIDIYNNHIRNMILTEATEQGLLERIQIVDVNKVLTKEHYSDQGLHLNTEGKEVFCKLISKATSEFGTLSSIPTSEESMEDEEDTENGNVKPDSNITPALEKSKEKLDDVPEDDDDMGFGLFD